MLRFPRSAKIVPDCYDECRSNVHEDVAARFVDKKEHDAVHTKKSEENRNEETVEFRPIEEAKPQQQLLFQVTNPITSELRCFQPETWQLIFIVSSTFTDTQIERDILMKEVVPYLREKARQYGIDIVDVDMRWGVKDDNTDHHMTWLACLQIIERCRKSSKGIFFLSLQSLK
jgi:hypothetical protein